MSPVDMYNLYYRLRKLKTLLFEWNFFDKQMKNTEREGLCDWFIFFILYERFVLN